MDKPYSLDIHRIIADNMPPIRYLYCEVCHNKMLPGEFDVYTCLREGWPKCHSLTMRLVTYNEEDPSES